MSARLSIVESHWGETPPDWVMALLTACEATSQNEVAKQLGYSGAVVSYVLRNGYSGDVARVEERVRAILMQSVVACPELGEIRSTECLSFQDAARRGLSPNPLRVRMRRACNRCPIYTKEVSDDRSR